MDRTYVFESSREGFNEISKVIQDKEKKESKIIKSIKPKDIIQ